MASSKTLLLFAFILGVVAIELASSFQYIPARENCKKGTLYHNGCNWCECMGTAEDECDVGSCEQLLADDATEYAPDPDSEEKRSIRSVKRKRSSEMCPKENHTFHENHMECFCVGQAWYWCREFQG